jgi:hypothetical protein
MPLGQFTNSWGKAQGILFSIDTQSVLSIMDGGGNMQKRLRMKQNKNTEDWSIEDDDYWENYGVEKEVQDVVSKQQYRKSRNFSSEGLDAQEEWN